MSKEQGPQPQAGDATGRDCRQPPTALRLGTVRRIGGGDMSREQVPREAGMRPLAIAAGRRQRAGSNSADGSEAAA